MGRILAISDIHGQADALERLLTHANYQPSHDRLFLLGDYIGKGPNSLETLQLVEKLVQGGAIALRGNHEQRVISQLCEADSLWKKRLPFLHSLPYLFEESDYLFVHAGIRPGIPLNRQNPEDLITIREPFLKTSIPYPKTIVFGHTPTDRLGVPYGDFWINYNKIGIDTGAGDGAFLSLADLTNRLQYRILVGNTLYHLPLKTAF